MTPKVLVVDDEQDVEMLFRLKFRRELKEHNIDFQFAFSGDEALNYLKGTNPIDVMLILSDINMPGMNGLELVQKIKNMHPEVKVMMVTAYGDDKNFEDAKKRGADDFVTKPVDFDLLKERMFKLIENN